MAFPKVSRRGEAVPPGIKVNEDFMIAAQATNEDRELLDDYSRTVTAVAEQVSP